MFIIVDTRANLFWQCGEWKHARGWATKYPSRQEAERVIAMRPRSFSPYVEVQEA